MQINDIVYVSFQRMDLGECPKIHDLALRADYEQASRKKDYYYDIDVSVFCNLEFNSEHA